VIVAPSPAMNSRRRIRDLPRCSGEPIAGGCKGTGSLTRGRRVAPPLLSVPRPGERPRPLHATLHRAAAKAPPMGATCLAGRALGLDHWKAQGRPRRRGAVILFAVQQVSANTTPADATLPPIGKKKRNAYRLIGSLTDAARAVNFCYIVIRPRGTVRKITDRPAPLDLSLHLPVVRNFDHRGHPCCPEPPLRAPR
jgi:hypothetical protein